MTVALCDIRDVRGYVARVVERKFSETPGAAREELISEGVAYLYELHAKWDPERCASFADFASTYLPLRLIDYWRREMRQMNIARRNGEDQSYKYNGRAESLEALTETGRDLPAPEIDPADAAHGGDTEADEPTSELSPLLEAALGKLPKRERLTIRDMVTLAEEGHSEMEIAQRIAIPWQELHRRRVAFQLQIVEQLRLQNTDSQIYYCIPSAAAHRLLGGERGGAHDDVAAAA